MKPCLYSSPRAFIALTSVFWFLAAPAQAQIGSGPAGSPFQSGGGYIQGGAAAGGVPVIRQGYAGGLPAGVDGRMSDTLTVSPGALGGSRDGERVDRVSSLPPNEFQKFLLENTGQSLPLFGATFFETTGVGFPSAAHAAPPGDYILGPGDEVWIRGWGSVDIDVRAVLDRSGQVFLPRVGAVPLAGVKLNQADATVRGAVGRYYRDFQLSVSLGQLRSLTVYVVGQARKPGAYALPGTSTAVSALFASGGPNASGSLRHVQVKRGGKVVAELDLYAFLARGDKSADIRLADGDALYIPPARGHVALTGKVTTPAVYELRGGDTLESILQLAGGLPVVADPKRVYLERLDPARKPARSVEDFALDAVGLKKPLKNGDLLTVLPLTSEFGNAVTLRGNVDQPVRVPWRDGMKVRDLIPSKSYLMSRASVRRQNQVLLSPGERDRAARGFTPPAEVGADAAAETAARESRQTADSLARSVGNLVDEVNLEYAVVERVDSRNVSVELLPFNLGHALADAGSPDNLPLQPGDIVTVFSVNDVRVPQAKRQVFVRVEGEVQRPGVYQMKPGETLRDLVVRAGGLTPDAYLFGAGLYRDEVRRAQTENLDRIARRLESEMQTRLSRAAASVSAVSDNASAAQLRLQAEANAQKQALERLRNLQPTGRIMLGLDPRATQPDALPALGLESQDRLVVPSRPDFVYVLGSVNTEASLIWREGQTVQDYLDLAGLTGGADKDQAFVVRADGSVLTQTDRWFGGVLRAEVMPGDTIVLPEKTDHETAWAGFIRNTKDITQIVYQLSLGAAAIKVLRD